MTHHQAHKGDGKQNLILFIVGRKGSGKSTLLLRILADYPRVYMLDTNEEYGTEQRFEVAQGFGPCVAAITDSVQEPKFRLSLRVFDSDEFVPLIRLIDTVPDCVIAVEEAADYCTPSKLPPELSHLLRTGRHRQISQIYTTQRPADVHRSVTANADLVIAFQSHEPRDLAYFRSLGGKGADDRVRDLPDYKVIAFGKRDRAPLAVLEALGPSLDNEKRGR